MTVYVQRNGQGIRETVDQFATRKEARAMLAEYRLADPSAEYYLSSRACKGWHVEPEPAPFAAQGTAALTAALSGLKAQFAAGPQS